MAFRDGRPPEHGVRSGGLAAGEASASLPGVPNMAQAVEWLPADPVAPRPAGSLNGCVLGSVEPDLDAAPPAEAPDPLVEGSAVGLPATALCPARLAVWPAVTGSQEPCACLAWHVLTFFGCCG